MIQVYNIIELFNFDLMIRNNIFIDWNPDSDNSMTILTNQDDDIFYDKDDTITLALTEKSKSGKYIIIIIIFKLLFLLIIYL